MDANPNADITDAVMDLTEVPSAFRPVDDTSDFQRFRNLAEHSFSRDEINWLSKSLFEG